MQGQTGGSIKVHVDSETDIRANDGNVNPRARSKKRVASAHLSGLSHWNLQA